MPGVVRCCTPERRSCHDRPSPHPDPPRARAGGHARRLLGRRVRRGDERVTADLRDREREPHRDRGHRRRRAVVVGPYGCAATDATVPDGAATAPTADLDGDGRADELWLADATDGTRTLGVRTASGAVLSVDFTSAAPQAASALGQVLGDGTAIVLLDTGRAVPLYAVTGCALVATENEQGEQYTFDRGFTGFGTGVGCEDGDGGLGLVGYLAETRGQQTDVTTTRIELSDGGTLARNGTADERTGLGSDDPLVTAATSVTCGDNEAAVQEPS